MQIRSDVNINTALLKYHNGMSLWKALHEPFSVSVEQHPGALPALLCVLASSHTLKSHGILRAMLSQMPIDRSVHGTNGMLVVKHDLLEGRSVRDYCGDFPMVPEFRPRKLRLLSRCGSIVE